MAYTPGSTADFIKYGPGKLKVAPVGTVEPADLTSPWDNAWKDAGWTEEGHVFTITPTFEGIPVAESLLDLVQVQTGETQTLEFAFAEMTAKNFQRALNGATITASGTAGTSIDKIEPKAFGTVATRVAIGWEADDASERWVWRKCLQTGAVAVARRRGATKATIPTTFSIEPVSASIKPFMGIVRGEAAIA